VEARGSIGQLPAWKMQRNKEKRHKHKEEIEVKRVK
jgi:hypothetical protein